MKAWVVAVYLQTESGQQLHARFVLAADRNEAMAAGFGLALRDRPDLETAASVSMTYATEISADLIEAAAADLKVRE